MYKFRDLKTKLGHVIDRIGEASSKVQLFFFFKLQIAFVFKLFSYGLKTGAGSKGDHHVVQEV